MIGIIDVFSIPHINSCFLQYKCRSFSHRDVSMMDVYRDLTYIHNDDDHIPGKKLCPPDSFRALYLHLKKKWFMPYIAD